MLFRLAAVVLYLSISATARPSPNGGDEAPAAAPPYVADTNVPAPIPAAHSPNNAPPAPIPIAIPQNQAPRQECLRYGSGSGQTQRPIRNGLHIVPNTGTGVPGTAQRSPLPPTREPEQSVPPTNGNNQPIPPVPAPQSPPSPAPPIVPPAAGGNQPTINFPVTDRNKHISLHRDEFDHKASTWRGSESKFTASQQAQINKRMYYETLAEKYFEVSYLNDSTHPNLDSVKKFIGGQANENWIDNTCVIRISHGFNEASAVPKKDSVSAALVSTYPGLRVVQGGAQFANKFYAIAVLEMMAYLSDIWAAPEITITKEPYKPFDYSLIDGKRGIIAIDWVKSGHFDVWNGEQFTSNYPEYLLYAQEVRFWALPSRP